MAAPRPSQFRIVAACLAVGLLLSGGLLAYERAVATRGAGPAGPALAGVVPPHLLGYRAVPVTLDQGVYDIAAAGDVVFNRYVRSAAAPVWVWVSYYPDQRSSTVHSPGGCYEGMGWRVTSDVHEAEADRWPRRWLRIWKEREERLVLYWYETGYGAVASELERNLLRIRGRFSGQTALTFVRLSTPTRGDRDAAHARLLAMAEVLRARLQERLAPPPALGADAS